MMSRRFLASNMDLQDEKQAPVRQRGAGRADILCFMRSSEWPKGGSLHTSLLCISKGCEQQRT